MTRLAEKCGRLERTSAAGSDSWEVSEDLVSTVH